MTIGVHRSEKCRHFVLRVSAGATIPDALATTLRDEKVTCGWLRGSGVLAAVDLRAYDTSAGKLGSSRRIEGPLQALVLEGSIGLSDGEPSLSLRGVLAREADGVPATLSGEIESARAVALEVFVTALDDLRLTRALDETAGLWLISGPSPSVGGAPVGARAADRSGWSSALAASDRADRDAPPRAPAAQAQTVGIAAPIRPPRADPEADVPFPEPGDIIDHFAFGPCDILRSDGDRLHLRLHKGGRIREIALGMLRVDRLPDADDGRRRFRLERRM